MKAGNPIGVFDSGVGGLTIYRALRAALPQEDFIYLADTARLPYGTKDAATVEAYTIQAARFLVAYDIKYLVIACNTVSAQALTGLQKACPFLPYSGVIAAGAEAAVAATRNGRLAVLATEGTVRSGVYPEVIRSLRPEAEVQMLACGNLVTLAEQGQVEGGEVEATVMRYLAMLTAGYDTLVLGCTHFPLLGGVLRKLCPPTVSIVDSAAMTVQAVSGYLQARGLMNTQTQAGHNRFFVTADPACFARVGAGFLRYGIAEQVALVDLGDLSLAKPANALNCD